MRDSGYVICGSTKSFNTQHDNDVFVVRTNKTGDTLWTKFYPSLGTDIAYSVYECEPNGFAVAGKTNNTANGDYDMLLMKIFDDGTLIWSKTFGGTGNEVAYDVKQTNLGGYILAGSTTTFDDPKKDVYMVSADDAGGLVWDEHYEGGSNNDDEARSLCLTEDGYIIATGTTAATNLSVIKVKICTTYFPRSLQVGSLWIPSNDTILPQLPAEPFPTILETNVQKVRFGNYVKNGHFSEVILAVDSLFAEDVDWNKSALDSAELYDSLSAYIVRLKVQYGVNSVLAWVQSTKDERASRDTSDNMDIIRRVAAYNKTGRPGRIDGYYIDYEYWEKSYGFTGNPPSDSVYKYVATGYAQFKKLLTAAHNYAADAANHTPYVEIYLNDLKRPTDTLFPTTNALLTDTLQAREIDSLAWTYSAFNLSGHILHNISKCKIVIAFNIADKTNLGCNNQNFPPTRFIHTSNFNGIGQRLKLFGLNSWPTWIMPQFSYEDSVGTGPGKDNNYLGDWKNGGNGDATSCWFNTPRYFYEVDSIFNDQFLNFPATAGFTDWGSISINGSVHFKYDKRSIDTLLTKDDLLFSITDCNIGSRMSNTNIKNELLSQETGDVKKAMIAYPNPFYDKTIITVKSKIDLVQIYDVVNRNVIALFKIDNNSGENNSSSIEIKNTNRLNGIFYCSLKFKNGREETVKLIIGR